MTTTELYKSEFKRRSTGVIESRLRLYTDDFFDVVGILPSLKEQLLIANFLDKKTAQIDDAIAIKEQQISLLKERKQIIIQQAVTQGLDPNVPMKDSGVDWIGKIPAHWGITPIKRICEAYGRIGFRGYNTSDLVNEGEGAITLSPSNLTEYEMDFTKCSYLSWEKYYESPEIQIMESDILIVKTGSSFGKTGFVNYLPMKATINPQLLVLKSIKVNCKYLYLLISSSNWQEQIKKRVIGSTIPTISETRLLSMQATVPPEEEQDKIILYIDEKLSEIDEIINLQHEQVNLFKEYKTTLINSAVTGKIKITPEMVEQ
ncbi:restriction endonuclease subunit S [Thiopseudomonas alkaliphila]|uniref:restriction endonuclease subunit S n=1 Tax=Thiopseudomonas alkaliphila TaxID=1697053 RepID=UPI00357129B9